MSQGTVVINGQEYQERYQLFPTTFTVAVGLSLNQNITLNFPGIAGFLLKGVARTVIAAGVVAANPFSFRFTNSDGSVNYIGGGIGALTDRVVDTNFFGNGQFPKILIPHIYFTSTGSMIYEVQDLSNVVPYTIHFAFEGSLLLPV